MCMRSITFKRAIDVELLVQLSVALLRLATCSRKMQLRRRNCLIMLTTSVLVPFSFIFFISRPDLSHEEELVQRLAELQVRLQYLEAVYRARQEDVAALQPTLDSTAALAPAIQGLLRNMTGLRSANGLNNTQIKGLRMPSSFHFLPHLLDNPLSIRPAFLVSNGRSGVSVVLGIPTVRREKETYLLPTLHNLVEAMNSEEAADSLIIVFIAETDMEYVLQTARLIENQFPNQIESGLIEILSPPASYYPDFDKLKMTLGDSLERVKWRTKQNLDFVFLMTYAQPKGTFYVQLEDDILAKHNFVTTMKNYAIEITAKKQHWFVLDFCQLGFIGKMFKSAELPWAITFFQMFYNDKPVDWLLNYLIVTKICNQDKDSKQCKQDKSKLWVHYKPSLFQHIGTHSSLKGKVQRLKDKQFGKVSLFFPHVNPPLASATSDIRTYKHYTLSRAYMGETYFWGLFAQQGDHLTFTFRNPITLTRFYLRSGNVEHLSDKFYNTTIGVLPVKNVVANQNFTQEGFITVGHFDSLGIAEGNVDPRLGKILAVRITVQSDSDTWVILSEIHFVEAEQS
ncbi:alpha-1,3-mannosyl-glycoprotein 4-beta-N-acetylglucosaminyltransferase a isoform X2 [Arctopsyche grandis]|uniref:alpha-1,3-mannosyl-glycoprotein 4-beta-N-acetylglucosaminyltransferase a isoform X2 n=1 Tax=Arctopsyche grandis TaxID=121162 RepID=UPI00406D8E2F